MPKLTEYMHTATAAEYIDAIMQVFDSRDNVDHFARDVDFDTVAANAYNVSVSSYVTAEDTRERVDISKLNVELKTTVARIDQLRSEIDAIHHQIQA